MNRYLKDSFANSKREREDAREEAFVSGNTRSFIRFGNRHVPLYESFISEKNRKYVAEEMASRGVLVPWSEREMLKEMMSFYSIHGPDYDPFRAGDQDRLKENKNLQLLNSIFIEEKVSSYSSSTRARNEHIRMTCVGHLSPIKRPLVTTPLRTVLLTNSNQRLNKKV